MSDASTESEQTAPAELQMELRAVESELEALTGRQAGFDFNREVGRVRGIALSALGRATDDAAGFESEQLSGQELADRMRELQRRRAKLKNHLEALD